MYSEYTKEVLKYDKKSSKIEGMIDIHKLSIENLKNIVDHSSRIQEKVTEIIKFSDSSASKLHPIVGYHTTLPDLKSELKWAEQEINAHENSLNDQNKSIEDKLKDQIEHWINDRDTVTEELLKVVEDYIQIVSYRMKAKKQEIQQISDSIQNLNEYENQNWIKL